jgi:predicted  nucleic acid-binding Zn-ribbon protein
MPITGDQPGKGAYRCLNCGEIRNLANRETLPPCSSCGAIRFSQVGPLPQGQPSSIIPEKSGFPQRAY